MNHHLSVIIFQNVQVCASHWVGGGLNHLLYTQVLQWHVVIRARNLPLHYFLMDELACTPYTAYSVLPRILLPGLRVKVWCSPHTSCTARQMAGQCTAHGIKNTATLGVVMDMEG